MAKILLQRERRQEVISFFFKQDLNRILTCCFLNRQADPKLRRDLRQALHL